MKGLVKSDIEAIVNNAEYATECIFPVFGGRELREKLILEIVKADARARAEG